MINHGSPLPSQESLGEVEEWKGSKAKRGLRGKTDWRDFWLNDVTFFNVTFALSNLRFVLKKKSAKCE